MNFKVVFKLQVMRYCTSMLLSLKILQVKHRYLPVKSPWLPIGRGAVNFIVHLITWLKILRFKIPFPTPVRDVSYCCLAWIQTKKWVSAYKPAPAATPEYTSWGFALKILYMLHVLLSALQASDMTECLSNVECDVCQSSRASAKGHW